MSEPQKIPIKPQPANPNYVLEVTAIEWVYVLSKSLAKFKPGPADVHITSEGPATVFYIRKDFYPEEEICRVLGTTPEALRGSRRVKLKPIGPADSPKPNVSYIGEA